MKIFNTFLYSFLLFGICSCNKGDNSLETSTEIFCNKICINVGLADTLLVNIPAHVGDATSYEWTATCSDSSLVTVIPDFGYLSATIITSNPTHGSKLTISIKAKNNENYIQTRKVEINIEGIGNHYGLVRDTSLGRLYGILYSPNCNHPSSLCLGFIDSSEIKVVNWFLNNKPVSPTLQGQWGELTMFPITLTDSLSAILIPSISNGCKSKINLQ